MSKRRSWFGNFSIDSLFVLLKQSEKELEELNSIEEPSVKLKLRKRDVEYSIRVFKNLLVKRILESNISLTEISKNIMKTNDTIKDVYKEVFTLKLVDKDELIDIELLNNVIDTLNLEQVLTIINVKKGTIYEKLANNRFNDLIFDVDTDVYDEYVLKKKMDEGRD